LIGRAGRGVFVGARVFVGAGVFVNVGRGVGVPVAVSVGDGAAVADAVRVADGAAVAVGFSELGVAQEVATNKPQPKPAIATKASTTPNDTRFICTKPAPIVE